MEYIVHLLEEVVKIIQDQNGAPYFFKGHRAEVNNVLSLMDVDPVRKKQRYPAVICWMDIDEKIVDTFFQYTVNLSIVAPTLLSPGKLVEDRLNEVFSPVLFPIYEKFMDAISNAGLFFWTSATDFPPHTRTVRPYWGVPNTERNRSFYLDDKLDCIDIRNLTINYEPICKESADGGYLLTDTGYLKR